MRGCVTGPPRGPIVEHRHSCPECQRVWLHRVGSAECTMTDGAVRTCGPCELNLNTPALTWGRWSIQRYNWFWHVLRRRWPRAYYILRRHLRRRQ